MSAPDYFHLLDVEDDDGFRVALDEIADDGVRHFLHAVRADRREDHVAAKHHYEAAIAAPRKDAWVAVNAPVRLVYCHMNLNEADEAISLGEQQLLRFQTVSPFPFDEEFELKAILANLYSGRGEFTRAIALTAEKPPPGDDGTRLARWGWSRSVVLFLAGMVHEALECGRRAAEAADPIAHPFLASGIRDNNDWIRCAIGERFTDEEMAGLVERASAALSLRQTTTLLEIELVTAFALANRDEHDEARLTLARLLDNPGLSGPGLARAASVLSALGDSTGAADVYRRSLDFINAETEPYLIAAVWTTLARLHEERGDFESSVSCLHAALEVVGVVTSANADPYCISI